jgi:hypothetical protein
MFFKNSIPKIKVEIRSKQWEVVKRELDKTILLCRNCHAELHDEEGWKHNQMVNFESKG